MSEMSVPPKIPPGAREGLLKGLDDAACEAVFAAGKRFSLERGETLFRQNDPAGAMFMLERGRVRLVQHTEDGRQVILRFIGPGEMIGIVAAMENARYPATAEAVEESAGWSWDGATLNRLLEAYPRMALNVIPYLISRVHEVQERYRELATERVERRIARVLLRLVRQAGEKTDEGVRIRMRLTRQDLAEMTGTTLFTVSRVLAAWEDQGYIDGDRNSIRLRVPHAIVSIAEELPK
jgi:CRP-like cAMP-binding protein